MQVTKDIVFKLSLGLRNRKLKCVKNEENLYMYATIIVSILVLGIDFFIVKQFIEVLNIIKL